MTDHETAAGVGEAFAKVIAECYEPEGWTVDGPDDRLVFACSCGDHSPALTTDHIGPQDAEDAAKWHQAHVVAGLLASTPAASTDPAPEGGLREAVAQMIAEDDAARRACANDDDCPCAYKDCYECGKWHNCHHTPITQLRDILAAHPAPETPEQVQGGGEPTWMRDIPEAMMNKERLDVLLSEFYHSDDGDYVSALGDIRKHVAARVSAAATRARAEGWEVGYQRGLRDAEEDIQHGADNPYVTEDRP